jgi:pimeloyl-ACP methyl ester carboxylesterase
MREEAALLPRVLDAAGVRRCILIGHSDGASIAAIHAGSRQDFRVRALVLIAPHFFVEDMALVSIAAIRHEYEASGREAGGLRARLARHHDDPDAAFRGWNGAWLDPGFPAAFDLSADVAHIRVPILIVQSPDDPYGTWAQVRACEAAAYCPVDVARIEGARHAPHLEAPEATLAAIGSFVHRLFQLHEPA